MNGGVIVCRLFACCLLPLFHWAYGGCFQFALFGGRLPLLSIVVPGTYCFGSFCDVLF